jgi:hypothetical protein
MRWRSTESIQSSRMSPGNAFPGASICWIWPLVSYLQLEHRNECRIGRDRAKVVDRHEAVAYIAYLPLNELCQEKETERIGRTPERQGSAFFTAVLARGISDFGGRVRHHQLERIQSVRA